MASDSSRLKISPRQAVRQRVQLRKKTRFSGNSYTSSLESWQSVSTVHWKAANDPINAEIQRLYQSYGLDKVLPLSPPTIEAWVKIAGSKPYNTDDEIVAVKAGPDAKGLQKVTFHVQRGNWHLEGITLHLTDAEYEITEESSAVIPRSEIPADVMAYLEPRESIPGTTKTPAITPHPSVSLDELELTVRSKLHELGADVNQDIEISAHARDRIVVRAPHLGSSIRSAVSQSLAGIPGVEVELDSARSEWKTESGPLRRIPEADASAQGKDGRLAAFFGSAETQEGYTGITLGAINRVLGRLHALQELAARWPPEQERLLSPAARNQLRQMVSDHSRNTVNTVNEIQDHFNPLLKYFNQDMSEKTLERPGTTWQTATSAALQAATRMDQTARSLLTVSDRPLSSNEALPLLKKGLQELQHAAYDLSKN